jgi:hypothetical protein
MPEQEIIKGIVFPSEGDDLLVQFEVSLVLLNKPVLLGLYASLKLFASMNLLTFTPQSRMAMYLGFTETTFIKHRRELEELGLITIEKNGHMLLYKFNRLRRLQKLESTLQKLKSAKTRDQINALLDTTMKSLLMDDENPQLPLLTRSIYINTSPLNTTNSNTSNTPTGIPTAKLPEKRFAKIIYTNLLQEYMKYKGISLKGAEVNIVYKAISTMLRSERTPEQIVAFMKWLKENEHETWVKNWTMWTVQKKLPEFLAGKFKERTIQDDLPRL